MKRQPALANRLAALVLAVFGSAASAADFDAEFEWLEAGRATRVGELVFRECRLSNLGGTVHRATECATLQVPENPAAADSRPIELFVVRLASASARPQADPLIAIAGGPGQSASLAFISSGGFNKVLEERDVYLLDQRGTGFSTPLLCQPPDPAAERSPAAAAQAAKTCLAELERDPRFFTTSVAVRDLEAVRLALGAPQLNLLGVSYGTRVAQHYARRYPDATRSLVLDGVVPPGLALGPAIAHESQAALEQMLARCQADQVCNTAFPQLRPQLATVLAGGDNAASADQNPPLTPAEIAATIQMALYHPATIALLPTMISSAAAGDWRPLSTQYQRLAELRLEAINFAMANSVICSEDLPFVAWEQLDWAALEDTFLGRAQLDQLRAICAQWPAGLVDADLRAPLAGATPVLLLSGPFDPVTPPDYARRAAAALPRAQLLEVPGQAHNTLEAGCVPDLIARFLAQPRRALDSTCLARVWQPPFFLSPNGPGP